ncbi:hypothetical protein ACG92U_02745 [Leuconostoc citreum]
MAKTGKLAAFKLGEKKTAMVNLPAQFVTASSANAKGQKYSNLVDYANNKDKTDDQNNESITELLDLKNNSVSLVTQHVPLQQLNKNQYLAVTNYTTIITTYLSYASG